MPRIEYKNWARKHRAGKLSQYIGDDIKRRILSRLSSPENYPRVILLEGMRGGGKTTMARLIAKEMLCEHKVNGLACDECSMCKELNENLLFADNGDGVDNVLEVNVATDGGKDAINTIIEEMDREPLYGKYKICILDECHRLTAAAQNALLKRLEEPKSYEVYILCTTEADKLLQPIKSRCEITLHIKPASVEDLTTRLLQICEEEKVQIGKEALKAIINACGRNPRESILKLEDLAKSNNYKIDLETVLRETGTVEADTYIDYFTAINKGLSDIITFGNALKDRNISVGDFYKGLTKFVISCIHITLGMDLDQYQKDFIKRVKTFFGMYTTEDIDTLLQILEYTRKSLNSDDSMDDLLFLTTSLRIGKIKLLAAGLYNRLEDSERETRLGNKKHVDEVNKLNETSIDKMQNVALNNNLIATAFGREVSEVNTVERPSLFNDDEDDEDDADVMANDESFLSDLNI